MALKLLNLFFWDTLYTNQLLIGFKHHLAMAYLQLCFRISFFFKLSPNQYKINLVAVNIGLRFSFPLIQKLTVKLFNLICCESPCGLSLLSPFILKLIRYGKPYTAAHRKLQVLTEKKKKFRHGVQILVKEIP